MYTTLGQTQFQVLGMSYTSRGCIRLGRPLPLWNFEKKNRVYSQRVERRWEITAIADGFQDSIYLGIKLLRNLGHTVEWLLKTERWREKKAESQREASLLTTEGRVFGELSPGWSGRVKPNVYKMTGKSNNNDRASAACWNNTKEEMSRHRNR